MPMAFDTQEIKNYLLTFWKNVMIARH